MGFEQYSTRISDARGLTSGQPLEWRVTFDPTAQVVTDLSPATLWRMAERVKANVTFLNQYRSLEANGGAVQVDPEFSQLTPPLLSGIFSA